ncbi:unnamed protein product [Pedinophyceae sp. YPF-701]|nr:unnamed protein product [Pedinophyceae sp. YPF-701]
MPKVPRAAKADRSQSPMKRGRPGRGSVGAAPRARTSLSPLGRAQDSESSLLLPHRPAYDSDDDIFVLPPQPAPPGPGEACLPSGRRKRKLLHESDSQPSSESSPAPEERGAQVDSRVAELEAEAKRLRAALDGSGALVESWKAQAQQQAAEAAAAREELAAARRELEQSIAERERCAAEADSLRRDLAAMSTRVEDLKHLRGGLDGQLADVKALCCNILTAVGGAKVDGGRAASPPPRADARAAAAQRGAAQERAAAEEAGAGRARAREDVPRRSGGARGRARRGVLRQAAKQPGVQLARVVA